GRAAGPERPADAAPAGAAVRRAAARPLARAPRTRRGVREGVPRALRRTVRAAEPGGGGGPAALRPGAARRGSARALRRLRIDPARRVIDLVRTGWHARGPRRVHRGGDAGAAGGRLITRRGSGAPAASTRGASARRRSRTSAG